MLKKVIVLSACLAFSTDASAESVTCPSHARYDVLVEANSRPIDKLETQPRSNEQDVGGDYDEKAPQLEWNFVNADETTTPSIAHCFLDKKGLKYVDVVIPETIKRCILRKGKFECRSGTVSCVGYVDHVKLMAKGEDGKDFELMPEAKKSAKGMRLVWSHLTEARKGLRVTAQCWDNHSPTNVRPIEVPPDMKECVFAKKRFICTDDPDRHDAFWPREMSR